MKKISSFSHFKGFFVNYPLFRFSNGMYHIHTEGSGDTSVLRIKESPLPVIFLSVFFI